MDRLRVIGLIFLSALLAAGCATTPKAQAPAASESAAPVQEDSRLKDLEAELAEQKVRAAEAEARAAKAENDLRELEMARTASKPRDPYLK